MEKQYYVCIHDVDSRLLPTCVGEAFAGMTKGIGFLSNLIVPEPWKEVLDL